MLRFVFSRVTPALLMLGLCAGSLHAVNLLTATPSTISLSCSTTTGPGTAATVVIKPITALTGSNTIVVSVASPTAGVNVTAPVNQTLSSTNSTTGITYSFNYGAGCAGASNGTANQTIQFKSGGVNDVTAAASSTVTATTSALSPNPSTIVLTCVKSGATYTPGATQTLSVTSAATGGTPFTVDNSSNPPPAFATVTPLTGGTATGTAVSLSVAPAAGCGGGSVGSTSNGTIYLLNAPAPPKQVPVSIQILNPSPLTASPASPSLTYVKTSGNPGSVDVVVSSLSNPAPFFTVDTNSLPTWLTVSPINGTVPKTLHFTSTSVADALAPGSYSATVRIKVSGYGDLAVPMGMLLTNPAPRLTVAEGTTRNVTWTVGASLPSLLITAVSSDSPIPYSVTTGGTLSPIVGSSSQSGLAYNFGTPIQVTFNPLIFAAAQPGTTLTGTVTLTWGNPAASIVVTINVAVQSPGATISAISPASLPTALAGQTFTVALSGSGFVPSTDPSLKTKIGIVSGGAIVVDTNISSTVPNASTMILTITVPATADANLPFSPTGAGGNVPLGVCNPQGSSCTVPTGTATLSIGNGPIIQAVTAASSFIQVTPPTLQTISPYDLLSVFGSNFCTSSGTGCSSAQILAGAPDPVTFRYPTSLSPDNPGATQRSLSVAFWTHGGTPSLIATAPVLFATNNQINLVVPSAVAAQIGSTVDMIVSFGYGTGATMLNSAPFSVSVLATNPGVFTIGADGQGSGAILASNWSLIAGGNEAGVRSTGTDSDVVQIFVTGLGAPDSLANNASAGTGPAPVWSTDCITTASYITSLNSQTGSSLTTLDGDIIQSSLLNTYRLVPCIKSNSALVPTVTFGGVAGTVVYAGWVADSVAGLYQINVRMPASTSNSPQFTPVTGSAFSTVTAPVQLPVVVTANSRTSQPGVTVWVAPRLKVVGPSGAGLTGTVGVPWASSNNSVTATEGTSPYRYAVTSGLLPSGLSLNAATGAITGTPAANTAGSYAVTVTATDSANVPVTGTVSFTLTIAGGLVTSASPAGPYNATFGVGNASLVTVSATGGTFPYTFAITAPATPPSGMSVDPNTGVFGVSSAVPAGVYNVAVMATDSASTPLTGTLNFTANVALAVSNSSPVSGSKATPVTMTTVSATGNTGSVTFSLDATSLANHFTINSATGAVSNTTSINTGTYSVTVTATDGSQPASAASPGTGTVTISLTVGA